MKKFAIAALLAGTMFVPVADASQVVFTSPEWRYTGPLPFGGGEFGASVDGVAGPEFYTFCLEKNEGLAFNKPYDFSTGPAAIGGGLGGGNPDNISQGTAWLYERFATGVGVADPANVARAASGRLLQNAIWMLEDEQAVDAANPFYALAFGVYGALVKSDYTGTEIGVLNPFNSAVPEFLPSGARNPDYRRQSVLINLPDNGVAVIMLGGSLMLLGAARRRMA